MTWLYVWLASMFPVALFTAQFMRAGKGPKLITIEEQSSVRTSDEARQAREVERA